MSMTNSESIELSGLSDISLLVLLFGTWLLASGIIILLLNLLGIPISLVVNNIPIALPVGFVGALLWFSLLYFSIFVTERFHKEPEVKECYYTGYSR